MKDRAQNPSGAQFLELATAIAVATCHYVESSGIKTDFLQELIKQKTTVKEIARRNAHELLKLVPNKVIIAKELIERFYLEVFDHKVNLSKVAFPEKEGFTVFGYNTRKFDVDQIVTVYSKFWGRDVYKYMKRGAKNLKHQQERPKGPYIFAYRGTEDPDDEHLNKSFNEAMAGGFPFANADEYLLMTGLFRFITGRFMDLSTETLISSLWSDGIFVVGKWSKAYSKLWLTTGNFHDDCVRSMGPREIVL